MIHLCCASPLSQKKNLIFNLFYIKIFKKHFYNLKKLILQLKKPSNWFKNKKLNWKRKNTLNPIYFFRQYEIQKNTSMTLILLRETLWYHVWSFLSTKLNQLTFFFHRFLTTLSYLKLRDLKYEQNKILK